LPHKAVAFSLKKAVENRGGMGYNDGAVDAPHFFHGGIDMPYSGRMQNGHYYCVFFAPRGRDRMYDLGM
jgi:hypothetical protein